MEIEPGLRGHLGPAEAGERTNGRRKIGTSLRSNAPEIEMKGRTPARRRSSRTDYVVLPGSALTRCEDRSLPDWLRDGFASPRQERNLVLEDSMCTLIGRGQDPLL